MSVELFRDDAAARHDVGWTVRQGMFRVTAGRGRLGGGARQEGHHLGRHLSTADRFIRRVVKYPDEPGDALSRATESPGRGAG